MRRSAIYRSGIASLVGLLVTQCWLHAADLNVLASTEVDPGALNFSSTSATFNQNVNGRTYQRAPMSTFRGYQYATYYDGNRHVCLARRKLPAGAWEVIRFTDYVIPGNDSHNVVALGTCAADGTIHLSFDHHADPLNYRLSAVGVASNAESVTWSTSQFGAVTSSLGWVGPLSGLTCPTFFNAPNGNLMSYHRFGGSGPSGGFSRATVFVFQLPDLGPEENPFTGATPGFNVESTSASPPGVDLHGLGSRLSPAVLSGDYYGETSTPDPTDAVLIQSNILHGGTGTGFMNSSAGSALAAYLNTEYDGGNGVGRHVFLRLTTNAPVTGLERHFVTSADAAGTNGPRISYTAVAPDYELWLSKFTFPPGSDTSPAGDPDLDGRGNWFEYLFGLDPTDRGSADAITAVDSLDAGVFHYTRANPALTGVTDYEIWISENLVDWTLDAGASQVPDGNGAVQVMTVTLSSHLLTAPKRFVQIRVE